MATKTWKIGEYCRGGIITVKTTKTKVILIGKQWDFSKGSNRGSDQSGAKEWTRIEININDDNGYRKGMHFLENLTTHYYADTIMKWVESKVDFAISYW